MNSYVPVIIIAVGLFVTMVLLLASKPRFASILTGISVVIAALGGVIFYGYGFATTMDNALLAVVRTLLAICGMFLGEIDAESVSSVPLLQNNWVQILFWLTHLFALYATASAAIITLGAGALRKLRLWLARWGHLNLIYGVTDASVALGRELLERSRCAVVFVDDQNDDALTDAVHKAGCVLRADDSALNGDYKFLKSIGAHRRNRNITLYALQEDKTDNLLYARSLLSTLKDAGIKPEQTNLVIRGKEDSTAATLQVLGDKYGYGFVTVFLEEPLVARMLIQNDPPCNYISFDENGKATEDFEAVIAGFGQTGQTVLRHLVMNGQFEGSTFRAAVFSPDCANVDGKFLNCFEPVLDNYDITFHPYDARSQKMFEYIKNHRNTLKYIVLCAGSEKINQEIAEGLLAYFDRMGINIPIHMCDHFGVRSYDEEGQLTKRQMLYRYQVLSTTDLDRMAMILNHHYMGDSDKSPMEAWMGCDYFSRMSCRASADFMGAMLHSVGMTQEQVEEDGWELSQAQLENLSRTEHLRWCAFHYSMGFSAMTEEEFRQRSMRYKEQLEKDGKATIRIGKNLQGKTHACLVDWEELDALAEREEAVTGKKVDYKAMDTDNVLAIPELIRACRELKQQ